jgi:phage-related minor tail protein
MSDIDISLRLSDNGSIKNTNQDAAKLNDTLSRTEMLTQKVNKAKAAAFKASASSGSEGQEYGVARGAVGTGAAGRDFAKQAQGLGGLVHVYATFAANLFAVSAAFNALSSAADTTNMIKGLEQLGAASGTNLGLLSKQLVDATDGAISLKDAMKATAQASAAGMSSENIKKLGIAARQTGAALGIDASDAISRLSRGITKLEPELLDELGIFTKLDKAVNDYARQIGKPASALTDFERRQAFANAVLDEANKKFGGIKIDANPYSKLLASLKDAAQVMLSVVNDYLGPVLKALAQSPTALYLGIAGLTGLLLKQAIPAISQWREQLHATAEGTAEAAARTKSLFEDYMQSNRDQAAKALPDTVKKMGQAASEGMDEARKQLKAGAKLYNRDFNNMMKLDVSEITEQHSKVIETTRKKLTDAANKAAAGSDPTKAAGAQARLDTFNQVAAVMEKVIGQQVKYNDAIDKSVPKLGLMGWLHDRLAKNAENASAKYKVLATAVDNATFVGPINAFVSMIASIRKLGDTVSFAGKIWLGFRGTLAIGAATLGMVTAALGNVMSMIGLVVGAVSMITAAFGKNGDEAERSAKSLDALKSNGEALYRTFELIQKQDPLERLSAPSTAAVANSMKELSDSILQAIKDTEKTIASRGGTDFFTNWLAGLIGKSDEQLLAKRLSKELGQLLDLAAKLPQSAGIKTSLVDLLGLKSDASDQDIIEAFTKQGEGGAKILQKLTTQFNIGAQSSKDFSVSLKDTTKVFNDMLNELKMTDKLSLVAIKSSKDFSDLGKILDKDVYSKLSAMMNLAESPEALVMLPKSLQNSLMEALPVLQETSKSLAQNQADAAMAAKGIEEYSKKVAAAKAFEAQIGVNGSEQDKSRAAQATKQAQSVLDSLQQSNKKYLENVAKDTALINSYTGLFAQASAAGFQKSSDILARTVTNAIQKSVIAVEQNALSKVSRTKEVIDRQNLLANKQVDLDISIIKSQVDLALETRALRLEMEQRRITDSKKEEAVKQGMTPSETTDYLGTKTPREVEIAAELKFITSPQRYKAKSAKDIAALGVNPDASMSLAEITGSYTTKKVEADSKKQINNLNAAVDKINLDFDIKSQDIQKRADSAAANFAILNKTLGTTPELRQGLDYQTKLAAITDEQAKIEKDRVSLSTERSKAINEEVVRRQNLGEVIDQSLKDEIARQTSISDATLKNYTTSKALELVQQDINDRYDLSAKFSDELNKSAEQALKLQEDKLAKTKQDFDNEQKLGTLSEDQIALKQRSIDIAQANIDAQRDTNSLTADYQNKLSAINKEREIALGLESKLPDETEAAFAARISALRVYYDEEAARILRNKQLKLDAADAIILQMSREKTYTGLINQAFKGMEDAIVNFTKTGKLSFKSMIDSFIEGLLRYEIQQQQFLLFQGVGGASGLAKMLINAIGMGAGVPVTPELKPGFDIRNAKGGVYDTGLQTFAKGGMFTNSVVSQPTLFKFAQGTGLMGEAGPEAIMPLKRDNNGNLGVRAGSGNKVDVVVNNYSNQQATTKETTDSRGNRRIEVIVGDMVAGELNRVGSTTQQAMTASYGTAPLLARR